MGLLERGASMRQMILVVVLALGLVACGSTSTTKTYTTTLKAASGITSSGTGTVTATLDGTKLTVTGNFSGLAQVANNSHIHGADGKPIFNLTFPAATSGNLSGSGDLTDAQIADLDAGKLYANVHSAQAGGAGEIEGFLTLQE
jgi:hypothetical protein